MYLLAKQRGGSSCSSHAILSAAGQSGWGVVLTHNIFSHDRPLLASQAPFFHAEPYWRSLYPGTVVGPLPQREGVNAYYALHVR